MTPIPGIAEAIPGIADVEVVRGARCPEAATPALAIEVPHGADRTAHYDALRERMRGNLPPGLVDFFHVNTDVGAWQLGCAVAQGYVARRPERCAVLVRCLLPRTLVDANRVLERPAEGMTPGLPPYVEAIDHALLLDCHAQYVALATRVVDAVCANGGSALLPHTYAPRTVGIDKIEADIVERLHWAWSAERVETWPMRPHVDLITTDEGGTELAIPGAAASLVRAYAGLGLEAKISATYYLHPSTQSAAHALRHPGKTLALEVRRDLLVEDWTPFAEMQVRADAVERLAAPLVDVLS